jgi:hypothetical protein
MRLYWLVGVLVIAAAGSPASAGVVGTAEPGPGGALTLNNWQWIQLDVDTYILDLDETLHAVPASVQGDILADGDPKVWIRKSVENDTSFAWGAYHIDIRMPVTFDILDLMAPPNWTWNEPTPAVLLPSGKWQASVDYLGGAPIPMGEFGDFGVLVSFEGSVDYCVDQIPIAPEPASLLLLAAAAGLLLRRKEI